LRGPPRRSGRRALDEGQGDRRCAQTLAAQVLSDCGQRWTRVQRRVDAVEADDRQIAGIGQSGVGGSAEDAEREDLADREHGSGTVRRAKKGPRRVRARLG
jgi:hypothetical protein